jgi:hypothetical protein
MNRKFLQTAFILGATFLVVLLSIAFIQKNSDTPARLVADNNNLVVDKVIIDEAILQNDLVRLGIPEGWSRKDIYEVPGIVSLDFDLRSENDVDFFECGMVKKGGHIMLTVTSVPKNELYDIDPLSYAKSLLPNESSSDKNFTHELVEVSGYPFALLSNYHEGCKTGDISLNARIKEKQILVHYQYAEVDQESAKKFFVKVVDKIKIE